MIEVALMMAGMEMDCALNVNVDSALPMTVFTNTETFTKNLYRDTINMFMLHPASLALIYDDHYQIFRICLRSSPPKLCMHSTHTRGGGVAGEQEFRVCETS